MTEWVTFKAIDCKPHTFLRSSIVGFSSENFFVAVNIYLNTGATVHLNKVEYAEVEMKLAEYDKALEIENERY